MIYNQNINILLFFYSHKYHLDDCRKNLTVLCLNETYDDPGIQRYCGNRSHYEINNCRASEDENKPLTICQEYANKSENCLKAIQKGDKYIEECVSETVSKEIFEANQKDFNFHCW